MSVCTNEEIKMSEQTNTQTASTQSKKQFTNKWI